LGFDALTKVIYHPDFEHVPKILETPYVDDKPPYYEEIRMIRSRQFDPELVNKIKEKK
jgi:deoxyribonuclease-4